MKNDGAVAQCLTPGASSVQSFAAACDSSLALLGFVWDAAAQGYLVKQGGTCLQVDYNAPDPQVLLPGGSPAAKVGWVACGSTGPGAVWVPTFVETDASNAGWYQLIPNARPGVPTPCLNLNLGASQSTQMLVEYTCQGGTHTEERWAPNESFWTAPGGTGGTGGGTGGTPTTVPPAPAGAKFFEDTIPTTIESAQDLTCLARTDSGRFLFVSAGTDSCEFFNPELFGSGIRLHILEADQLCLGLLTGEVQEVDCNGLHTVWSDIQAGGFKQFVMRLNSLSAGCLSRSSDLAYYSPSCGSPGIESLFYDRDVSSTALLDEHFFDYDTSDVLIREKGDPLVIERIGLGRKIIKVVKILKTAGPGFVFLSTLMQDGGLSGGLPKQNIFPNLYTENPAQLRPKLYARVSKTLRDNEESRCKDLVNQRATSLVEGPDQAMNAMREDIGWNVGATKTGRTIAVLFYCWKEPNEFVWRSGVAMAISGGTNGDLPALNSDFIGPFPVDPTIVNAGGDVLGVYDAERKLLSWAFGQTSTITIGTASLAHSGPSTMCPQCRSLYTFFNDRRKGIVFNYDGRSDWFRNFPSYMHMGGA